MPVEVVSPAMIFQSNQPQVSVLNAIREGSKPGRV